MTAGDGFSFDGLISGRAPAPRPGATVSRAKYDFAVAYPDPDSLPLDDLAASLRSALEEEGRDLAVYPHVQGYPPLREYVADKLMRTRSIDVTPDDIILADGSSQPLHMIIETLIEPGDVVLTEDYFYSGTLNILRRFEADVRGVACDDEGIDPDALEEAIDLAASKGRRPKMVYTIPTFQNPQGWTMTLERRKALVRVAQRARRADTGRRLLRRPAVRGRGRAVDPLAGRLRPRHVRRLVLEDHRARHEAGLRDRAPAGARRGHGREERRRGEPVRRPRRPPVRHVRPPRPRFGRQPHPAGEAGRDAGGAWARTWARRRRGADPTALSTCGYGCAKAPTRRPPTRPHSTRTWATTPA